MVVKRRGKTRSGEREVLCLVKMEFILWKSSRCRSELQYGCKNEFQGEKAFQREVEMKIERR